MFQLWLNLIGMQSIANFDVVMLEMKSLKSFTITYSNVFVRVVRVNQIESVQTAFHRTVKVPGGQNAQIDQAKQADCQVHFAVLDFLLNSISATHNDVELDYDYDYVKFD